MARNGLFPAIVPRLMAKQEGQYPSRQRKIEPDHPLQKGQIGFNPRKAVLIAGDDLRSRPGLIVRRAWVH